MKIEDETKLFNEFMEEFPSEEACVTFFRDLFRGAGLLFCHHCGSLQVEHQKRRTVVCVECGNDSWFTSGTFIERIRKFMPLLGLIWFQIQGHVLNAARLSKLFGISPSSASALIRKVELALLLDLNSRNLLAGKESAVVLSEAFSHAIRKRSRVTPASKHPRAEIRQSAGNLARDTEAGTADATPDDATSPPPFKLSEAQNCILKVLIEADSPVCIDQLSALSGLPQSMLFLELISLQFEKLINPESGGKYSVNRSQVPFLLQNSNPAMTKILQQQVSIFVDFCHENFHGISRKYLQLYTSLFSRVTSTIRDTWDSFMHKLLRLPAVSYKEILAYESPQAVWIALHPPPT